MPVARSSEHKQRFVVCPGDNFGRRRQLHWPDMLGSGIGGGSGNSIHVNVQNSCVGEVTKTKIRAAAFAQCHRRAVKQPGIAGDIFGALGWICHDSRGPQQHCDELRFRRRLPRRSNSSWRFRLSDNNGFDFPSTNANSFSARAMAERVHKPGDFGGNPTAGVVLQPGSGSWTSLTITGFCQTLHL